MNNDFIEVKRSSILGKEKLEINQGNGWEDWTSKIEFLNIRELKTTSVLSYTEAERIFGSYPNFPKK